MAASQSTAGHLLNLIRAGQAYTRGDLLRLTGLSRSTVGNRLDQLFQAGWLCEVAGGVSTGGRPSTRLEFDTRHAVVLAADLETTHTTVALLDLEGRVIAEHSGGLPVSDGPEAVLDQAGARFAELLAATGTDLATVCGVGVAVPGPVDRRSGRITLPPIMPGWDDYPVQERLRQALAEYTGRAVVLPVLVDNDANLMALGEQREGFTDCTAFVLVKVSTGIGAGVVIDGSVFHGTDGGAGDLGHIRLHDRPEARCMCGSYGCLAAVASGGALAGRLTDLGISTSSAAEVRKHLTAGQPDAVRLAREAGKRCGEVLVTVVSLLNPGVLMIAGDLAETHFVTGVRELLYQRALPRATRNLQVVTARLGVRAGLVGAATMVVDALYAPERADARLALLRSVPEGVRVLRSSG